MIITDQQERLGIWFCEQNKIKYYKDKTVVYIGLEINGELVAATAYDNYLKGSICSHIAIKGKLNREFLWYMFHYPFIELNIKKLIGPISSNNTKALKFVHHLGFNLEAVISDAGDNCDLHLLTMTRDQCRFIRSNFK